MQTLSEDGEDSSDRGGTTSDTSTKVSLSQLLDNVVVLEEMIKEVAAIIQARVSLGIDDVRYV